MNRNFLDNLKSLVNNIFGKKELLSPLGNQVKSNETVPLPTVTGSLDPRTIIARQIRDRQMGSGSNQIDNMVSSAPVTPTSVPSQFNYEPFRSEGNFTPSQPPSNVASLIQEYFPNEATQAALTAATESNFNPNAQNLNPGNNSEDYGLFQINSDTLSDYLRRLPRRMESMDISSVDDLHDAVKNVQFAKLIRDLQGWGAWYGPRDKGFNIERR